MRKGIFSLPVASCLLVACSVQATQVYVNTQGIYLGGPSPSLSLQSTLNALGNTSINVYNDQLDANSSAYYNGSGVSYTITVVEALAGSAAINSLSIYNMADPSQQLQLFPGGDAGTTVSFTSPWTSFGFVLHNGNYGNTEYGDPSINNGNVNAVTYAGTGETLALGDNPSSPIGSVYLGTQDYLMAWEDTDFTNPSCDHDYNDLVYELGVVPETSYTAGLLLAALAGLCLFRNSLSKQSGKA